METKAYQLILSPDLDLSPSEIVAAWNADAQASTIATVRLAPSKAKQFDPSLLEGIVTLVSTVGLGILTNALNVTVLNTRRIVPFCCIHTRIGVQCQ